MAIEIIDILSQKNNGEFPLVDSNDIRGGNNVISNQGTIKESGGERQAANRGTENQNDRSFK